MKTTLETSEDENYTPNECSESVTFESLNVAWFIFPVLPERGNTNPVSEYVNVGGTWEKKWYSQLLSGQYLNTTVSF